MKEKNYAKLFGKAFKGKYKKNSFHSSYPTPLIQYQKEQPENLKVIYLQKQTVFNFENGICTWLYKKIVLKWKALNIEEALTFELCCF